MDIPAWPQASEREIELLRDVLESSQWGGFHPYVGEFEARFAAYQHCRFGISAFNGTVTLELALNVLGVGPGDEVILPAISFISSATAVSRVGATPVFVDIEEDSFNIDPQRVRQAVTAKTRALMPVHFGGAMCRMPELAEICREFELHLIEDAAHAQGSEWNGRRAGSFGVTGSFSFQNGKVLSAGEGGMLGTSDEGFAAKARSIANCGRSAGRSFYEHARLGTNFRMSGFQAAVLLAQLERLPGQIACRADRAALLQSQLVGADISWQKASAEQTQNSWYLCVGRCETAEQRDGLCRALSQAGVPCTPFYPHTLYQNEAYSRTNCRIMPCPVAESRIFDSFWLPHRVLLAKEAVIHQIAAIARSALSGVRPELSKAVT